MPAAVAFSNNDVAVVAWTFDLHLDGCLRFAVGQIDIDAGKETVLPTLARFANQDKTAKFTTEQAAVQKFWWKDLFARRGKARRLGRDAAARVTLPQNENPAIFGGV